MVWLLLLVVVFAAWLIHSDVKIENKESQKRKK